MKIAYKSSLQRTMILYFLMISFASVMIAAEFTYDMHSDKLRTELMQNFEKLSSGGMQPDAAFQPIQAIGNKAVLMVALCLAAVLILLTMFIKTITEPLQHMIEVSRRIAAGDLSQTVNIHTKNELAELGDTVNELTSDLQEMILLSGEVSSSIDDFTGEISELLASETVAPEKTESLQRKIQTLNSKSKLMKDIILHCKFYGMER